MKKFEGKVVLITGATSGIGMATAKEFIKEGAKVIITGRFENSVNKTVSELGTMAYGIVSDASKISDLMTLAQKVGKITPVVDILYVNAGIGKYAPIEQIDEAHFDEMFDTIVKGTLFTVQQILPLIPSGGSIILNTSIVTEVGMANSSVYSAAKAAVQSFVKTFACELAARKIRVNAVSPGPIKTNYFDRSNLSPEQVEAFAKTFTPELPLQRFGEAEEVAKAVLFLASDDASYIHGAEISVDGGFPKVKKA